MLIAHSHFIFSAFGVTVRLVPVFYFLNKFGLGSWRVRPSVEMIRRRQMPPKPLSLLHSALEDAPGNRSY